MYWKRRRRLREELGILEMERHIYRLEWGIKNLPQYNVGDILYVGKGSPLTIIMSHGAVGNSPSVDNLYLTFDGEQTKEYLEADLRAMSPEKE